MKFNFLLRAFAFGLLLLGISFASCKKDQQEDLPYFTESELAELRTSTCLTLDDDAPYVLSETPEAGAEDRATGAKKNSGPLAKPCVCAS